MWLSVVEWLIDVTDVTDVTDVMDMIDVGVIMDVQIEFSIVIV